MAKPSFYKDLTEEEKAQYDQNAELASMEFEQELAAYMGDSGKSAIDSDKIYVDYNHGYRSNLSGAYINPEGNPEFQEKMRNAGILEQDETIPPDSVYLQGEPGLTGDTASHEFRHRQTDLAGGRQNKRNHDLIYMMQGFRAGTQGEWEEAVTSFADYVGIEREESEKAEKLLSDLISKYESVLIDMEARGGLETRAAVANPPNNEYDEVGLLGAYEKQAQDMFEYRKRRINQ